MELNKAVDQISEIQKQLAKTEVYQGYRPLTVILTGASAVIGAYVQPRFVPIDNAVMFIWFWSALAVINLLVVTAEISYRYIHTESSFEKNQTLRTVGQFIPCVVAGFPLTYTLVLFGFDGAKFLPGIWAMLFSLGIFASRPFLPKVVGWVGLYYLIAATILITMAPDGDSLNPWGMGLTYGIGQGFSALVFYLNIERNGGESDE